jgi:hypothetical protein
MEERRGREARAHRGSVDRGKYFWRWKLEEGKFFNWMSHLENTSNLSKKDMSSKENQETDFVEPLSHFFVSLVD